MREAVAGRRRRRAHAAGPGVPAGPPNDAARPCSSTGSTWAGPTWTRSPRPPSPGPSALTIAELRVLRFLPSHLSFREIAARLGVSPNTVKTQAHGVYRKLGAASRSEAVARAQEAGLLGSDAGPRTGRSPDPPGSAVRPRPSRYPHPRRDARGLLHRRRRALLVGERPQVRPISLGLVPPSRRLPPVPGPQHALLAPAPRLQHRAGPLDAARFRRVGCAVLPTRDLDGWWLFLRRPNIFRRG